MLKITKKTKIEFEGETYFIEDSVNYGPRGGEVKVWRIYFDRGMRIGDTFDTLADAIIGMVRLVEMGGKVIA